MTLHRIRPRPSFRPAPKTLASSLFALAALSCIHLSAAAQTTGELAEQMRQLREELSRVRQELEQLKRDGVVSTAPASGGRAQGGVPLAASAADAPAASSAIAAMATRSDGAKAGQAAGTGLAPTQSALSLFGYGEMSFSRPRSNKADAVATVRRGVIGLAYRFNERTRLVTELEVENAVVSSGDQGEIALEQFYIEHDVSARLSARAGLFLMPVGFLNTVHEPTRYYGVMRNAVETAIIPTTWRELGLGLFGQSAGGLKWDVGLVTGFDLSKWDASASEGKASPLGSIHQEGQLAKAASLAAYAALNYHGVPGLHVGGSLYGGGAGQGQSGFAGASAQISLAEGHLRWQQGRWDLSALAAFGRITGTTALNATFAGQATPVPSRFSGAYVQAAYKAWSQGEQAWVPFARYERLNTAKAYEGLAQGLAPAIDPDTRILTAGFSFYLNPQVVLKFDAQRYLNNSALDRFSLGLGFHF